MLPRGRLLCGLAAVIFGPRVTGVSRLCFDLTECFLPDVLDLFSRTADGGECPGRDL